MLQEKDDAVLLGQFEVYFAESLEENLEVITEYLKKQLQFKESNGD